MIELDAYRANPLCGLRSCKTRVFPLQKCLNADGTPDLKKATLLLEVYAIEIQMCSAQKNFKRLKELYDRALSIKSAIPHPRIMGIIREHGGKMHMRERAWEAAHTDFFEAFKSYDDAGSPRRYALLCSDMGKAMRCCQAV